MSTAQSKLDHIKETKKMVAEFLRMRRKEFVGDVFQDELATEEFEHSLSCVAEVIDDSYWQDTKGLRIESGNTTTMPPKSTNASVAGLLGRA